MGAINYGTSDYITLGYNCNTKYVFDDFWEDEEEQRNFEIGFLYDEIKEELDFGLVQVWPSWCTSYETHDGTIAAIKTAIKKIRAEIRDTPTWYTYNHSA